MSEAARAPRPIYVFEKGENHGTRFEFRGSTRIVELTGTSTDGPLVSCIMITRGDPKLVATSVEAFAAQTYANKELVIVCDDVTDALRGLVARRADVRLIAIDEVLPLGTLRNEGTRAARGDILCQWDDDDLFSPQRLEAGVSALLRAGTRALFLLRWMIWWPKRKFFGVSAERLCEGSMFVWKDAMGVYPALRRCEDTQMVEALCRAHDFALLDDPASYCYVIHGGNTWDEDHMSTMIERCSLVFEHDHAVAEFSPLFGLRGHAAFDDGAPAAAQVDTGEHVRLAENCRAREAARRVDIAERLFLDRMGQRFRRAPGLIRVTGELLSSAGRFTRSPALEKWGVAFWNLHERLKAEKPPES